MKMKYRALCASAVLVSSLLMTSITTRHDAPLKEDDLLNNDDTIGYEDTIIDNKEPEVEIVFEEERVKPTPEATPVSTPEVTPEVVQETPEVIPEKIHYDFGYIGYNTDVFDSMMNRVTSIEQYQKVVSLYDCGSMKKVEYSDNFSNPQVGFVYSDAIKTLPNTFIEVDISEQTLRMYIDGEEVLNCLVVTGNMNTSPTDLGCFYIWAMEHNVYLKGYNSDGTLRYSKYVNYWMPFNGGQGIHDAEVFVDEDGTSHGWRQPEDFGGSTYLWNGSGGCVNQFNADAKFVYENSEVGTKVLVHK